MDTVTIRMAMLLTGESRTTLWRAVTSGLVSRGASAGKGHAKLELASVLARTGLETTSEDIDIILRADAGDADAQTDLGVLLLEHARSEDAVKLFVMAADQGGADAMQWLGKCYAEGTGVGKDHNMALKWIAQAAAQGHVIAKAQMDTVLTNSS